MKLLLKRGYRLTCWWPWAGRTAGHFHPEARREGAQCKRAIKAVFLASYWTNRVWMGSAYTHRKR